MSILRRIGRSLQAKDGISSPRTRAWRYPYATTGGARNDLSGLGTANDKTAQSYFDLTFLGQYALETIYRQSWAAAKMIDIVVDDAFIFPRRPEGSGAPYLADVRREFDMDAKLRLAIKTARLHGSALLIVMSREDDMARPLQAERVRRGDVTNLWVVSRWDVGLPTRGQDPFEREYGQAESYRVQTLDGAQIEVHASRTVRFDGQTSLSQRAPQNAHGWGTSILYPVLATIVAEDATARAAAQLAQEKSILVVQSSAWKMAVDGMPNTGLGGTPEMGTFQAQAQQQSQMKSVYKTMYVSDDENVQRVDAAIMGLSDVMDAHAVRLSAAAGVPHTRFMAQSPAGMSSTGESDARNYAMLVRALQRQWLDPAYDKLDPLLARSLAHRRPVRFDYPSLAEPSKQEQAEYVAAIADYLRTMTDIGSFSPEEARGYALQADPVWQSVAATLATPSGSAENSLTEEDDDDDDS